MAYDNNYKGDIDTNRTDRFSSLYIIISKIGLGCVTYFMVGLVINMIYVLSDMDYFTLNGQFRNQRFFTDDGYYYTKQLVIIYGLFAFILTMFIGPVGIIPCIIWSWLLTISYISMSVYMNSTNPDKYNKLLIRFIGFISFISHSLLCNFIFYLFYPMNSMFSSYIYDYDIKLTNSINNSNNNYNNHNSRSSYTFYRILSFMGGYFIGCSLLSFVLSIKTDMRDSLYPINNHNNVIILLLAMLIASSISMLTSLLLSFQFVYEYILRIRLLYKYGNNNDNSSVTNSYNEFIDRSRYVLDTGTFVWFPINKHTNNVISKNFHTIIDIELLVVWILNPFIITLIPYTIPSHFQFRKQSFIHKLLFSLIFIIIFMFLNDDLIFSYLFPTEFMNSSVFNIVYSNQFIQLNDDHLRHSPVSTNHTSNLNCFSISSHINNQDYTYYEFSRSVISTNTFLLPGLIHYYFDNVTNLSDYLLFILNYTIYLLLQFDKYSIKINDFNFNFVDKPIINTGFNYMIHFEYNTSILTLSQNYINQAFWEKQENDDNFLYMLELFSTLDLTKNYNFFKLSHNDAIDVSLSSVPFIRQSIKQNISSFKMYNSISLDNGNFLISSNQDTKSLSEYKKGLFMIKIIIQQIPNLISNIIIRDYKMLLWVSFRLINKLFTILKSLMIIDNCHCIPKLKCLLKFRYDFYKLKNNSGVDSNPYPVFYEMIHDKTAKHLCLCLLIMDILRPNILISLRYLVDSILDMLYTYNRRFDKNTYAYGHEQLIIKFILIMFDILDKIVELIKKYLSIQICEPCFCKPHSPLYYSYFMVIIIYVCSLMENIFNDDIKKVENKYKRLLNLISGFYDKSYEIALKGDSAVEIKDFIHVCKSLRGSICNCVPPKTNGCCCKTPKGKCCCCIICRNIKIICLTICFGCHLCCICCDQKCQCYQNIQSFCNGSNETGCGNENCNCQQICQVTTSLIQCPSNCCSDLCKEIKSLCTPTSICHGITCSCEQICSKIQTLESQCNGSLKKICEKLKAQFSENCKEKKFCCKIVIKSIYLLYNISRLSSWYYYNESKFQYLFCLREETSGKKKEVRIINLKNCENILLVSKNNRICDTICKNEDNTSCGNGNIKDTYGNRNLYNNEMDNDNTNNVHKLKQSRIIIALGLIFLILCLRISFDTNDDNNNIYKSNRQMAQYNIENNNLLGSMYNIFVNNNMKNYTLNRNGEYVTNTNNSNIKQNKMIYFMTMLVSLISALYMNMVIRNMYDKLRLEYDIWSYLINMILMTGMMSSLLSKYSVHIFDFVGVLDKYGMNLYKSESFIDYVDKGDKELIDNISSPVKNMMMYGLFKSMTKDLTSLVRYKDKTSTTKSSKTTYSKMKNKLYPYKEMSKPIHRITKYCDKCQHSLCKIQKSVINNFGNDKSIDIVSVLDFLSYTMIYNQMSFINQYESYFSGDELYMIWKLNKFVNNNMFVTEYYRHQTLNKIEQDIKQLINDNKLGSYNLILLWEIFGENEIRNITLKSMSDINDQQMIQNQRDILLSMLYDEYLKDFYNFQEYVCNTYLNTKLVTRSETLSVNNITEFTNILNKHILDKSTIQHLANLYSRNTHDCKIKSLMLPTVNCNITGNKDEVSKNIKSYCNDWLKNKLLFCKHIKSPYCEEAVNIAYNTIIDLANKSDNLYQQILDLLTNMDLKQMDNIFEKPIDYIPKLIKPICKDCESMSLYYINQYLLESLVNIDRMLRPLGMYLSWNGTPILSKHLYKYGHKY